VIADESVLDAPERMSALDSADLLLLAAGAARAVREAARTAAATDWSGLVDDGRPRALLVVGAGDSALPGTVLRALAGAGSPIPVLTGTAGSAWVGLSDLVIVTSATGRAPGALSALEDAGRRGARAVAIGPAASPLAAVAERSRAVFVPVPTASPTTTSVWSSVLPALTAAEALRVLPAGTVGPNVVEATAARLEEIAMRCRPSSELFVNAAKGLAAWIAGGLPLAWGTTAVAAAAAEHFVTMLASNARYPALRARPDELDDAAALFDGAFGARAGGAGGVEDLDDFFRDRVDEPEPARLRLLVLRDAPGEAEEAAHQAAAAAIAASERGVVVTELAAEGAYPLERLASLVGLIDFASVYLAFALGLDPAAPGAARELARRSAPA
jgi:glucose/mannose-6-phosphate isomerase